MPWVKLDDHYPDHPKLHLVGAIGLAIQTAAICFCGRHLTDGKLSFSDADSLIRSVLSPITDGEGVTWGISMTSGMVGRDADEFDWTSLMVEAGLWDQIASGFRVHDYLNYNPTRREWNELQEKKQLAGKAGGQASAKARAQAKSNPVPVPVPVPKPKPKKKEKEQVAPDGASLPEIDGAHIPIGTWFSWEFWPAYPKHNLKGEAEKAIRKLNPDNALRDRILRALEARKLWAESAARGAGFLAEWPDPHRWVRREQWTDEPPPWWGVEPYRPDPSGTPSRRPPQPLTDEEQAELDRLQNPQESV